MKMYFKMKDSVDKVLINRQVHTKNPSIHSQILNKGKIVSYKYTR